VALIDLAVQLIGLIVQIIAVATGTPLRQPKAGDSMRPPAWRKTTRAQQPLPWSKGKQKWRTRNDCHL
jgi:hypothetical protein